MANINDFFNWFTKLGGDTAKANIDKINQSVNPVLLNVSTFKGRAQEIKDKYNYKFSN